MHQTIHVQFQVQFAVVHMQMAADKGELEKESSMLRSKLVAEKQHAAVLQVMLLALHSFLGVVQDCVALHSPYHRPTTV